MADRATAAAAALVVGACLVALAAAPPARAEVGDPELAHDVVGASGGAAAKVAGAVLTTEVVQVGEGAALLLSNVSPAVAWIESFTVQIDGRVATTQVGRRLEPHQGLSLTVRLDAPPVPGDYAVEITVRYRDAHGPSGLVAVHELTFEGAAEQGTPGSPASGIASIGAPGGGPDEEVACRLRGARFDACGDVHLWGGVAALDAFDLRLPPWLAVESDRSNGVRRVVRVCAADAVHRAGRVYAVAEHVEQGRHEADVCYSVVESGVLERVPAGRGRVPAALLGGQAVVFLALFLYLLGARPTPTPGDVAAIKYASRMVLVAVSYGVLANVDLALVASQHLLVAEPWLRLTDFLLVHVRGSSYDGFFRWVVDPVWLVYLIANGPYLYWVERDRPLDGDKYASLLGRLVLGRWTGGRFRSERARVAAWLGLRTWLLKLYFVPYLTSWAIGHAAEVAAVLAHGPGGLDGYHAAWVHALFTIDAAVFACAYLLESRLLRNEIRSVDPTWLGWIVCLWCYAPFDSVAFLPFDVFDGVLIASPPVWLRQASAVVIAILWLVYLSATLALGLRSANLANRGLVERGPYRWVRHPHYASKLVIWFLTALVFHDVSLSMWAGFVIIYALRGWTEERHLARDPAFAAYFARVRWRFVPGLV